MSQANRVCLRPRSAVELPSAAAGAVTCCFSFRSLKGMVKMSSIFCRPRTLATPCVDTLSTRCRLPVVGSPRKSTCRSDRLSHLLR